MYKNYWLLMNVYLLCLLSSGCIIGFKPVHKQHSNCIVINVFILDKAVDVDDNANN